MGKLPATGEGHEQFSEQGKAAKKDNPTKGPDTAYNP